MENRTIYHVNPDGYDWVATKEISEEEQIPEGWTIISPPTYPTWKLMFDWDKNEWIETATWFEKMDFNTAEEAYADEALKHIEGILREHEEKRAEAQKQLLNLVTEQYLISDQLTDGQKELFTSMYPLWMPEALLNIGDKVVYQNGVYEVIQTHTSQSDWLPDLVPALYKVFYQRATEDEDGEEVEVIPDWVQPIGGHDAYKMGDTVRHDGKIYESTANGNVWVPGVYGWKEIVT